MGLRSPIMACSGVRSSCDVADRNVSLCFTSCPWPPVAHSRTIRQIRAVPQGVGLVGSRGGVTKWLAEVEVQKDTKGHRRHVHVRWRARE